MVGEKAGPGNGKEMDLMSNDPTQPFSQACRLRVDEH